MSRDDDPQHPNWHGIRFQTTTDRQGVVAVPTSADAAPPVTFIPYTHAQAACTSLTNLAADIRHFDHDSYLAFFLDSVRDDLAAAIRGCKLEPGR